MSFDTIKCERCCGKGRRATTHVEYVTLVALGFRWKRTSVIRSSLGNDVSPSALINRLNDLVATGLVVRRKLDGRHVEWRLK